MVNHHPAKFGGHRQCGSGDIILLVVEEHVSTCFCLNPLLWFICLKECLESTKHILYQV